MRNSGGGCGPVAVAVVLALLCGGLVGIALTRADVFRTQPPTAAVATAYMERARVETDAIKQKAAADLQHAQNMRRIDEEFAQTLADFGKVAIGIVGIGVASAMAVGLMHGFNYVRTHAGAIRPNNRGQFPIIMDTKRRIAYNPNMLTAPALQLDDPEALQPELQLAAFAWQQRANIAASMSQQRVLQGTALAERKAMQAALADERPAPGGEGGAPIDTTNAFIPPADDGPQVFIVDNGQTRPADSQPAPAPIVNNQLPNGVKPNDDLTEQQYHDLIHNGQP